MKRSVIRGFWIPDSVSLHPGYAKFLTVWGFCVRQLWVSRLTAGGVEKMVCAETGHERANELSGYAALTRPTNAEITHTTSQRPER